MTFHPNKSLAFFDPTTLQPIQYSTGSVRTSNTWVNPNSKNPGPNHSQPNAMLTSLTSQRNGQADTTWIPNSGASFHVIGDSPSSTLAINNNSSTVMSNFVSSSLSIANLWHARLGHPNDHVMKLVLTHCNIPSSNKNSTGLVLLVVWVNLIYYLFMFLLLFILL